MQKQEADAQPIIYLAFSSDREDQVSDIWVIAAEGGEARRLTTRADAFGPTWSPDGARIVFDSDPNS